MSRASLARPEARPGAVSRLGVAPRARSPSPAPATPRGPIVAAAGAFAALVGYAVLRYAVFQGEPLASLPLWMANKAVAVFATLLLAAASLRPAAAWRAPARSLALAAGALHGLASLALLRPAYYRALFAGGPAGRMNAAGELAILCGAAALVAFGSTRLPRSPGAPARFARRASAVGAALVVAHCAAMGLPGWLSPRGWPGGLPPMTLGGALLAAVALGAGVAGWARARARRAAESRGRGGASPPGR